jgi:hypothetical protein
MKLMSLPFSLGLAVAALLIGCGAGHLEIVSITVTPTMGDAPIIPPTDVEFTAIATFDNQSSGELTDADGLAWTTSNSTIATIDNDGSATCVAPGQVTITATVPSELNITVNNGINNTSMNVSGTAQLMCVDNATPP